MAKKKLKLNKTTEEFTIDEPSVKPHEQPFNTSKKDFSYFLRIKRSGDGVLMMTYDLFCNI